MLGGARADATRSPVAAAVGAVDAAAPRCAGPAQMREYHSMSNVRAVTRETVNTTDAPRTHAHKPTLITQGKDRT